MPVRTLRHPKSRKKRLNHWKGNQKEFSFFLTFQCEPRTAEDVQKYSPLLAGRPAALIGIFFDPCRLACPCRLSTPLSACRFSGLRQHGYAVVLGSMVKRKIANEFQQANLFELSDDDIRVTYSSSSFAGSPLFSYRDSSINRQFRGEEIRSVETEIGKLLTVTIEQIPDLRTVTFTLVLPAVTVLSRSAGTHIQVPGIKTATYTTIAGPALGPEKTYSLVNLRGTAQVVVS